MKTLDDYAQMIDHTNLHADASSQVIQELCQQAIDYHFRMVAINPLQVETCQEYLKNSDVHVGAAIAFPLGQLTVEAKRLEAQIAIEAGADEIDYVVNLTAVKDQDWELVKSEMQTMANLCRDHEVISKVIFENCYLSDDEIRHLAQIAREVKIDFIKTSTGFGPSGAKLADVRLMKDLVGDQVKVKAAGGIRTAEDFLDMVDAGAERIGTSAGVEIIQALKEKMN
ncbi:MULTISPECIES: deoxyribose-phosphate aldolase [Aerococcus]|uniref:deoxyribose-phosphate aldolase n=1 Tax=Aerococcus TaxID=1375 RepID=UPI000DCB133D|nr:MULTISPECIES: deoxyribose-phosphate aldolase [Aerococcus]KAA9297953.1 deoxyribose-phosphate aldolase [Aerococcus tenax]MDK6689482.1 deoxyribose-phosphate aldolase [Aerococcus urinae]MDK8133394.1 deoxyribose-phosphate aldolase [Aerococcus urinae]MDK8484909.1 deoxyribose-phosphate aldolase [Aerococcus urinae]MDL5178980.1 deoxyribose-phosphate aldolase [Aerococcus tenax]